MPKHGVAKVALAMFLVLTIGTLHAQYTGGYSSALNDASLRALQQAQTNAMQAYSRCLEIARDASKCGPPPSYALAPGSGPVQYEILDQLQRQTLQLEKLTKIMLEQQQMQTQQQQQQIANERTQLLIEREQLNQQALQADKDCADVIVRTNRLPADRASAFCGNFRNQLAAHFRCVYSGGSSCPPQPSLDTALQAFKNGQ